MKAINIRLIQSFLYSSSDPEFGEGESRSNHSRVIAPAHRLVPRRAISVALAKDGSSKSEVGSPSEGGSYCEAISQDCRALLGLAMTKFRKPHKFILGLLFFLPSVALAQPDTRQDLLAIKNLIQQWYIGFLLPIGTILAGIVIIIGGIIYTTSGGDTSKTGRAKELIIGALTGLVLLITAALIIETIIY